MTALTIVAIAVLGGLAAVARFALDEALQRRRSTEFPLGTFAVNIAGSFALGVLVGAGVGGDALLIAGTATLGSFTTFSTWMFETHRLAQDGEVAVSLANVALSLGAGVGAVLLGRMLGDAL